MAELVTIPTTYAQMHVCTSDWMIECDGCGMRLPAIEEWRDLGTAGLAMARALLSAEGWVSDEAQDTDRCRACAAFDRKPHDSGEADRA